MLNHDDFRRAADELVGALEGAETFRIISDRFFSKPHPRVRGEALYDGPPTDARLSVYNGNTPVVSVRLPQFSGDTVIEAHLPTTAHLPEGYETVAINGTHHIRRRGTMTLTEAKEEIKGLGQLF